jgi:capsular polysaccharide transport system ATP-binding protein
MVSHDPGTLKRFCTAGMVLHQGKLTWFDRLGDAIVAYKESLPA